MLLSSYARHMVEVDGLEVTLVASYNDMFGCGDVPDGWRYELEEIRNKGVVLNFENAAPAIRNNLRIESDATLAVDIAAKKLLDEFAPIKEFFTAIDISDDDLDDNEGWW